MIQRVTLMGAGAVSTHLGYALQKAGVEISQVYSRTVRSAEMLAGVLRSAWTTDLSKIDTSADLIVLALKDDVLEEVLRQTDLRRNLLAHTAGSLPLDLLKRFSGRCGVLYPVQTFSKTRPVDFSVIPVCVEGSSAEITATLKALAGKISGDVREISSEQRKMIHLAAVFACNFVNHCYDLGARLLEDRQLDFDMLLPVIKETATKVQTMAPFEAQTGPARRNDRKIIEKHLRLLEKKPELRKIYEILTESIFLTAKKNQTI